MGFMDIDCDTVTQIPAGDAVLASQAVALGEVGLVEVGLG